MCQDDKLEKTSCDNLVESYSSIFNILDNGFYEAKLLNIESHHLLTPVFSLMLWPYRVEHLTLLLHHLICSTQPYGVLIRPLSLLPLRRKEIMELPQQTGVLMFSAVSVSSGCQIHMTTRWWCRTTVTSPILNQGTSQPRCTWPHSHSVGRPPCCEWITSLQRCVGYVKVCFSPLFVFYLLS